MVPGLPNQRQGHGDLSKTAREEPPFGLSVWVCPPSQTTRALKLLTQHMSPLLGYSFYEKDRLCLLSPVSPGPSTVPGTSQAL